MDSWWPFWQARHARRGQRPADKASPWTRTASSQESFAQLNTFRGFPAWRSRNWLRWWQGTSCSPSPCWWRLPWCRQEAVELWNTRLSRTMTRQLPFGRCQLCSHCSKHLVSVDTDWRKGFSVPPQRKPPIWWPSTCRTSCKTYVNGWSVGNCHEVLQSASQPKASGVQAYSKSIHLLCAEH